MSINREINGAKIKSMSRTKATSQPNSRTGSESKKPSRVKLESKDWYLNAAQSIAIGHSRDNRGRYHWVRYVNQRTDQH